MDRSIGPFHPVIDRSILTEDEGRRLASPPRDAILIAARARLVDEKSMRCGGTISSIDMRCSAVSKFCFSTSLILPSLLMSASSATLCGSYLCTAGRDACRHDAPRRRVAFRHVVRVARRDRQRRRAGLRRVVDRHRGDMYVFSGCRRSVTVAREDCR